MKAIQVNDKTKHAFFDFCRKHREVVDDSFLYDEDLRNFTMDKGNPTYLLFNDSEEVIAAASLMTGGYFKKNNSGRFRIFYSESHAAKHYEILWEALKSDVASLKKAFVFVPLVDNKTGEVLSKLHFEIERYAFIMLKKIEGVPSFHLPEGYELKPLERGQGKIWCDVRNPSFATLKGAESAQDPEDIEQTFDREDYVEGGKQVLYQDGKAVAVVACSKDDLDGIPTVDVGPVAVHPDHQGKGLGRLLLHAAEQFAHTNGYKQLVLSVNGENERAKRLYEQEGYEQIEGVACYTYLIEE